MKNEFESQLLGKDVEIRKRDEIIEQVRKIVGSGVSVNKVRATGGNVEMWIDKLGRTQTPGKILSFLAEKSGLKFTRSQIRLAIGISAKSSGLSAAVSLLKRNQLIIEQAGQLWINPEL